MRPALSNRWWVFLLMACAATGASAQTYRCVAGSSTYYSDKPCSKPTIGTYGPARSPATSHSTALPRVARAEEHVKYLGAECSSISEAIRTAPARGVRGDVVRDLRDEYRRKCDIEDQEARKRQRKDRELEQDEKAAQRDAVARDRMQAARQGDRCNNMRDVISLKRKREASLNEKEVEALRGLERTFNETCLSR